MTYEPISLQGLEKILFQLVQKVHGALTDSDRRFLVSFKKGATKWPVFAIPEAERLPAIQWKILNLNRMDGLKRQKAIAKLKKYCRGRRRCLETSCELISLNVTPKEYAV